MRPRETTDPYCEPCSSILGKKLLFNQTVMVLWSNLWLSQKERFRKFSIRAYIGLRKHLLGCQQIFNYEAEEVGRGRV